ncbi:MAG TPA: cation diffusion facilitator family transporter [Candidatus Rubrimentiphilum sp.]|nr:cation diffusion facilitator family transporter [Candidatus Rubrimentiphilum sp.]
MPRRRLTLALVLVAIVAAVEFWGGMRAGSLALLADAVHVCMDVFALGIALAALAGAQRPANVHKTFGYGRLEVLGALANGTLLLAATFFILYEAAGRFSHNYHPQGALMSAVAGFGLIVNAAVALLLVRDRHANLNVQAAIFHVAGDALGAFAVIAGGIAIAATGISWIDPALSIFVSAIIVAGVLRVLRDATDVLLESTPRGMTLDEVLATLVPLAGIVAVHDLHVWTIGTGDRALSAHVLVDDRRVSEATAIAREIDALVRARFGVTHVTLQFECESCAPEERVICTQPRGTGSEPARIR